VTFFGWYFRRTEEVEVERLPALSLDGGIAGNATSIEDGTHRSVRRTSIDRDACPGFGVDMGGMKRKNLAVKIIASATWWRVT
jgi:hypothetical protein